MLTFDFLNVGNGDSMLLTEEKNGKTYRLLVDTGHESVPRDNDSGRKSCLEHLKSLGVDKIDLCIVSHLHIDHFGGLKDLLEGGIEVSEVWAPFFPPRTGMLLEDQPALDHSSQGLLRRLNLWAGTADRLVSMQIPHSVIRPGRYRLGQEIDLEIIVDLAKDKAFQVDIWNQLYAGIQPPAQQIFRCAKLLNPTSPRLHIRFAGHEIMLGTDCYGEIWEEIAAPCTLVKIPHHGDAKSVTRMLVQNLRAKYAVISARNSYMPEKDRPSELTKQLILATGARLWYTDHMPGENTMNSVVEFVFRDDGQVIPPLHKWLLAPHAFENQ